VQNGLDGTVFFPQVAFFEGQDGLGKHAPNGGLFDALIIMPKRIVLDTRGGGIEEGVDGWDIADGIGKM
jgi:hypothetical protein